METHEKSAANQPQINISASGLESLKRAVSGQSFTNFPAIFQGFAAKGIPESEIKPRENVFTFQAWKALGRVVRRGEHGVGFDQQIPRSSGNPVDDKRARYIPIGDRDDRVLQICWMA